MNSKNIIFSCLFLFLGTLPYFAQSNDKLDQLDGRNRLNTITTALPFMGITPDSRAGAMGDAGTALSPNSNSVYWNTSMLNFSEKKAEVSLSYTPWLRHLANDIHLSNFSFFSKFGTRHAIGGNFRYFSLGMITFTDNTGQVLREDTPNEFEATLGYAFKLSEKMSFGINGKFANSNLTGGLTTPGANTKAARTGAADISFSYVDSKLKLSGNDATYALGITINNIGNKVSYTDASKRDFIPTNLKIGNSYKIDFDQYNDITFALDLQKLLVPSPPIYNDSGQVISGKTSEVGVIGGMLQSFYDAPGFPELDENGDVIEEDGKAKIQSGSKFKEELREINICFGMEYWYNNVFAIRTGYFYEHKTKGARQYFNIGLGLKYNMIGIDLSYLLAVKKNNPLANTLRFSLRFDIGNKKDKEIPEKPE